MLLDAILSVVALESPTWAGFRFCSLIFCWFLIVTCCARLGWKLTANFSSPRALSIRHISRLAIRSITLCLVFAPTIVILGFVGFPAPASLVIFLYAVLPGRNDLSDYTVSFYFALVCFLISCFILFTAALFRLNWRLSRDRDNLRS